jgi:hypothetical protein
MNKYHFYYIYKYLIYLPSSLEAVVASASRPKTAEEDDDEDEEDSERLEFLLPPSFPASVISEVWPSVVYFPFGSWVEVA